MPPDTDWTDVLPPADYAGPSVPLVPPLHGRQPCSVAHTWRQANEIATLALWTMGLLAGLWGLGLVCWALWTWG